MKGSRLWAVGFYLIGSMAEFVEIFDSKERANNFAAQLDRKGYCWRVLVWEVTECVARDWKA